MDGDEDRQQRGPRDPAAKHVDRVVRAEIEACGADRADEHDRDEIGAHALPNVVCQASDAEGGQPIEDGGAQRMPGREVGDVVETDAIHVEDRVEEGREADRLRRREVLQRPLHREAERAEGQEEGEVAAATGEGQQPERGEGQRHEPAAAERADPDDQRVEQREMDLDPGGGRHDERLHHPLFRQRGAAGDGALEHDQPEQRGQGDHRQEERRGRAGDGSAQSNGRLVMDDEAAHDVRQPSHGA